MIPAIESSLGWMCPYPSEYRAYDVPAKLFVPPNFPVLRPADRPVGCFVTSRSARHQGYSLAPTPPGYLLVGGIYLTRAGASFASRCTNAGPRVWARFCPKWAPAGWPANATILFHLDRLALSGSFAGPPGYIGVAAGEGHLNIWAAGPRGFVGGWGCPEGRFVGRAVINGTGVRWKECPAGSELDSGHLMLEWRDGRTVVAVSIHGYTRANRAISNVVASSMISLATSAH